MKKNFKYLLLTISILFIFPLITNAAGIKLEGNSNKNVATYNIIYDPTDKPVDESSVNIKINSANDGITYDLKIADGIVNHRDSDLNYTVNIENITSAKTIATVTMTNNMPENQEKVLTIDGTYKVSTEPITLKGVSTTTTTTTTQRALNTDNNLSGLTVSVGALDQTFSKDIKEYSVTGIKDTVNSVTITPTCAAEGCSWVMSCPLGECSVTNPTERGRISLQTGANKVSIVVTSEDKKSNKTYILNIYRGEVVASSAYLSGLEITDAILSPSFDSMTNDYTLTVGLDVEKLDIITTTEDPSAKVVIKGNEDLKEGENTITITVTSSDGESKQVYTLIVTKEDIEEEPIEEEKENISTSKIEKKKNNTWLIIILSIVGLTLIVIAFLIIFKRKKKKNKNDKNDKNNKGNKVINDDTELLEKALEDDLMNTNEIAKQNTANLHILNETKRELNNEPKQDIDEALDDLMKTKRLELGDLDF